ncbi:sensor domain-containing protein, partial [Streptomyces huiliensis]|uniref:sensor domain-containing protein n=1 Tax=Streptomyces huiliensis TaxID=2876027 RepID=UPI001CC0DF65
MAIDYRDHGHPADPAHGRHRLPLVLRAPLSGRTWRAFVYLQLSLPISIAGFTWAVTTVSLGLGLLITFVGLPVLALGLAGARLLGAFERTRARVLLGADVETPLPVQAENRGGGFMGWVWALLKSGVSWRHMVYAVVQMPWAICAFTVSLVLQLLGWSLFLYPAYQWMYPTWWGQPGMQVFSDRDHDLYLDNPFELAATSAVGLAVVLVTPWLIDGMATMDRMLVKALLSPSKLAVRVAELEQD